LENQRLPQRVRLFKFLEGDLHRQIKLLDRPRRKDNRELRLYSLGQILYCDGYGDRARLPAAQCARFNAEQRAQIGRRYTGDQVAELDRIH